MNTYSAAPSAARLTKSLRDIGYDFVSAVADLIDNSIAAGATEIAVDIEFLGSDSTVFIADNGCGMTSVEATEALRFGTRRNYEVGDLGRYGLGLKTAALSQGRCLTLVSRSRDRARSVRRSLDLNLIERWDDWVIVENPKDSAVEKAERMLGESSGTVVIVQQLDRVLPSSGPESGWAKRRFESLIAKTRTHLSMVFHRFLSAENSASLLSISVNGHKLRPWDPFVRDESATQSLEPLSFEIAHDSGVSKVALHRFILPGKRTFSSPVGFDAAAGPLNWNRQQGLYIYRENRLVQWGSWGGIRGIDEHTKLARASVDFDNSLDEVFKINVAKMRVSVPSQLRQMLDRPISELCILADRTYRRQQDPGDLGAEPAAPRTSSSTSAEVGLALKAAAIQGGHYDTLREIIEVIRQHNPDLATSLGF